MLNKIRTTNILLLVIVIPLVFYLLKILSFIFIPLIFSMFIALLFLPLMRWLGKRKVPKVISVFIVFLLIIGGLNIGIELVQLSNKEIMATDAAFFNKAENKLNNLIFYIEDTFGVKLKQDKNLLSQLIEKENIGSIIDF
jgi:predicted PurR-regulated permease PerM